MKIPSLAGLLPWIRDQFLLGAAERASLEGHPGDAGAVAMRRLRLQAARRHQEAARELSRPRHAASSMILYRASITEALAAGSAGAAGGVSPLASADGLAASLAAAGLDERARTTAGRAFFELDAATLAELRWGELHALLAAVDAVTTRLIAGIELRSRATLRRIRALRVASATAVTIACAAVAVAAWRAPRNLALHAPITASHVLSGSPAGLVNGSIEWGSFAFHSYVGEPSWVLIDLGSVRSIQEVRIWNRGDQLFEGAAGTQVELSDDGATFRPAATCEDLFTQATPCRLALEGARARYVRLFHPVYLVLSEVEVLGWR